MINIIIATILLMYILPIIVYRITDHYPCLWEDVLTLKSKTTAQLRDRIVIFFAGSTLVFLLGYITQAGPLGYVVSLVFIFLAFSIAWVDIKERIIPDLLSIPFLISGIIASPILWHDIDRSEALLGASVGYILPIVILSTLRFRYKQGSFGGGDVKLLAGTGAWVGLTGLSFSVIASLFFVLLYFLFTPRKDNIKSYLGTTIPYAPFLLLGILTFIVYSYRDNLVNIFY
ncbi:MAG: prepilin peptidase [Alphaproteobacteria bacterium]|nr:prepilin peptidase [Alphaproteobacteria bacterium]MBL0717696.1 prepilin peptidase [Alphaproteobacteria bacterium]